VANDARSAFDVVSEIYDTHRARNTPRFGELLADDVVWHTAEGHPLRGDGPWIGRDAVVGQITNPINHDWDNYITEVQELIDAGDRVISIGRYRGVYKATGRPLDAEVCTIFTVRDGLISEFRQFTDTAQFRWAMGVDEAAANPGARESS
jgi:ketosteroid isomerase-like protein